ncbi:IS110 family transposase, partial [Microcoleus sp. Pol11C3]|uniref:IS110 family transposase n=1 Tax=Microcoleus sp. Pol11C3 TaxID=3055390 RepID=UPI002FD57795
MSSIAGMGEKTASVLLPESGDVFDYENACQLPAYAGLTPCKRICGTSVKGKTCLSCTGNIRLRKALYLPAVVAMRYGCISLLRMCHKRVKMKKLVKSSNKD